MEVDRKPQPKRWFLWSLLVDEDCPRYIYSIFASFGPKISVNILSVNILDPAQPENQWTRRRNEQWIRRRPCAPPKWPLGRGIATTLNGQQVDQPARLAQHEIRRITWSWKCTMHQFCRSPLESNNVCSDPSMLQRERNPHGPSRQSDLTPKKTYPLVISHSHGKWPIYRWFTY